jgi:A/G-specific adenine glycosylase
MEADRQQRIYFTRQLTHWHHTANTRDLPWKSEKDPYKIWLSEVILQQTRALQGLPYYQRFIAAFPTIKDMAEAKDDDVFRLWQGLGYYNRCRNMLATARYVANDLGGDFPQRYEAILALKGIGPYTAAAIASFAYGLPHAVVDGNVYRVLARYFGIETPFDTTEGKKEFATLAQELLDARDSAAYNQAIMDLGATVCTPRKPLCETCPLQRNCVAYNGDIIDTLPVRSKKQTVRNRYFHFLLLHWQDQIWIEKRGGGDIWASLHQPLLIEADHVLDLKGLQETKVFNQLAITIPDIKFMGKQVQRLTHQLIESHFFLVALTEKPAINPDAGKWMNLKDLKNIAFPGTLVSFLQNNLYF